MKIKEALKTKYSNLGLGDELLQSYADGLAATGLVTDENLATVIQGQEQALKEFQRGYDKLRTESSSYKSQLEELQKKIGQNPQPNQNPNPQPTQQGGDEMPEWFKTYAAMKDEEIKALKTALTQDQTATRKEKREALFNKAIEGLDDAFANPIKAAYSLLGDDVDDARFQEFITSTQSSAKEIIARNNSVVPSRGVFTKGEISDKEAETFAKNLMS